MLIATSNFSCLDLGGTCQDSTFFCLQPRIYFRVHLGFAYELDAAPQVVDTCQMLVAGFKLTSTSGRQGLLCRSAMSDTINASLMMMR